MDTLYHLQKTPYGGRGLFSILPIPKDTLLHTCASPYAAVILRVFRKEVCGQCFAYAFDANRNAWNIKSEAQDGHSVWFCGVSCRDVWAAEQDIGGLLGLMNAAVEKLVKRMKKPKEGDKLPPKHILRPENVTLETLDLAWKAAERINTKPGSDPVWLNELELNTARFVISGIVRRYLEDTMQTPRSDGALSWSELLALQNNEAQHIRSHPHILESQLRVYTFLRRVVVPVLQPYIATSETVRAILARDHGNVFGMWDMSATGDSEMLGWSMYVSASYFNHDCSPNVRKERSGRAMQFYTTRDVSAGEELCINYVDVHDTVLDRRAELLSSWYFDCACKRCEKELVLGVGPGTIAVR